MATERKVYFNLSRGSHNLCSDGKQWQLYLHTPYGSLSETFEDEPSYGDSVEDVLAVIEARAESYWMSSRRPENRINIAAIKANLPECEMLYATRKLGLLQAQADRVQKDIVLTKRLIVTLQDEMAEGVTE